MFRNTLGIKSAGLIASIASVLAGCLAITVLVMQSSSPAKESTGDIDAEVLGVSTARVTTTPPVTTSPLTKVVALGDSQAYTLAAGFSSSEFPNLQISNGGISGCGVVRGYPVINGHPHEYDFRHCNNWEQHWRSVLDAHQPDVTVMMVGAWEILDRIIDGRHFVVGAPDYDAYIDSQLTLGFEIATQGNRPLALLTSPCYREAEASLGGLDSDRNDPLRRKWFNELAAKVASRYGDLIKVIDLGMYLCPEVTYTAEVNGFTPRPDGVHFDAQGAQMVWRWLAPQISELAARHRLSLS